MKLVHVEDYFDPTAGYQINELLYASRDSQDTVYLVTSTDMSPFHKVVDPVIDRNYEEETGVKIIRLKPLLKISSRLLFSNLHKTLLELEPDVVFMHGIGDFKDLLLWKRKSEYKVVRDCHMSWVASRNRFNWLYYYFFKIFFANIINRTDKYEKVFALGVEEHEYLKRIGVSEEKIDYLKHGYNETVMYFSTEEREEIRAHYAFKETDIVVSYIGKFDDYKRPDLLVDILSTFDADYLKERSIKILLIGPKDDAYMMRYNDKFSSLADKLSMVVDGAKPFRELRKYYSASDICIFPKETSLSSIHAQICGCPVIMENHVSNNERVVKKDNLFEVNNLNQATDILKRIIERKEYLKKDDTPNLFNDREYKNQVEKLRKLI